jgi:hypothetical protein
MITTMIPWGPPPSKRRRSRRTIWRVSEAYEEPGSRDTQGVCHAGGAWSPTFRGPRPETPIGRHDAGLRVR